MNNLSSRRRQQVEPTPVVDMATTLASLLTMVAAELAGAAQASAMQHLLDVADLTSVRPSPSVAATPYRIRLSREVSVEVPALGRIKLLFVCVFVCVCCCAYV